MAMALAKLANRMRSAIAIRHQPTSAMLGLYVHVPFCSAICNYCNFNRGLFDAELKARYVDGAASRRSACSAEPCSATATRADTIFFGGGTPSLLEPDEIARDHRGVRGAFDVAADARGHARGESRDRDRGAARRVSRAPASIVSASACSRFATTSCAGSRGCTARRARAPRVGEARAAGFDNVSLDLMMWLPGADASAQWLESVDARDRARARASVALHARGVSERAAQGRDGARPLVAGARRRRRGDVSDGDGAARGGRATRSTRSRTSRGPGRRSRHNLKYWTDGEWLGFGCGAHSTRGGVRWKNVSSTTDYIDSIARGASPARRRAATDAAASGSATRCSPDCVWLTEST